MDNIHIGDTSPSLKATLSSLLTEIICVAQNEVFTSFIKVTEAKWILHLNQAQNPFWLIVRPNAFSDLLGVSLCYLIFAAGW